MKNIKTKSKTGSKHNYFGRFSYGAFEFDDFFYGFQLNSWYLHENRDFFIQKNTNKDELKIRWIYIHPLKENKATKQNFRQNTLPHFQNKRNKHHQ